LQKIIKGDCLIESEQIESGSVDLILTDPPYGTIKNNPKNWTIGNEKDNIWDNAIKPKQIYDIANRLLRKNGRLILFSQQPYTTELIKEQIPNLPHSYNLYWYKNDFANGLLCNKAPVNYIEEIVVFSKKTGAKPFYDYQGEHPLRDYFAKVKKFIGLSLNSINENLGHRKAEHSFYIKSTQFRLCTKETYQELIDEFNINNMQGFKKYKKLDKIDNQFKKSLEDKRKKYLKKHNKKYPSTFNLWEGNKYKSNVLEYKKDYDGYHPTQKPVALLEDLIKTYTNEGDLVVDLTAGSGSTGVACQNTNRDYILIEKEQKYYEIAKERLGGSR